MKFDYHRDSFRIHRSSSVTRNKEKLDSPAVGLDDYDSTPAAPWMLRLEGDDSTENIDYDGLESTTGSDDDDENQHSYNSLSSSILGMYEAGKISLEKVFGGTNHSRDDSFSSEQQQHLDATHLRETIEDDYEFIYGSSGSTGNSSSRRGSRCGNNNDIDFISTMMGSGGTSLFRGLSFRGMSIGDDNDGTSSTGGGTTTVEQQHPSQQQYKSQENNKYEKEAPKKYSHNELLEIFEQSINTEESFAAIVDHEFHTIQREMKRNGFVTDLASLQISRGIVSSIIIRDIEKEEARKLFSSPSR